MALWKQLLISAGVLAASVSIYALISFGPVFFNGSSASAGLPSGGGRPPPLVVLATVGADNADSTVRSIGTAQAIERTTLYGESAGRVEWVGAVAGEHVQEGDVILKLDDRIQQFALDRAHLAVSDAEEALERYQTLAASNTVSDVALRDAALELEKARLDVREAEDALARRSVHAPFTGDIGLIDVGIGDYVTTSTSVATLDDRSTILIDFRIPERFANQVEIGQPMSVSTPALPGLSMTGEISGLDSRVDTISRTLTVQGTVENANDLIRPGMSFEVSLAFAGSAYASVPSPAVQWDSSGAYVMKTDGNLASRVPVEIVSRQDGRILIRGDIIEGDEIVSEGIDALRPGQPFRTPQDSMVSIPSKDVAHG